MKQEQYDKLIDHIIETKGALKEHTVSITALTEKVGKQNGRVADLEVWQRALATEFATLKSQVTVNTDHIEKTKVGKVQNLNRLVSLLPWLVGGVITLLISLGVIHL